MAAIRLEVVNMGPRTGRPSPKQLAASRLDTILINQREKKNPETRMKTSSKVVAQSMLIID